ncbi:MBL fold metallo-hydrolase [Bacillaceae bacterium S4-13-58]
MKLSTIGYWGAYPKPDEATSCYLVQDKKTNILLDCGSGALAKLQNIISLEELDAVFISHIHPDHIADLYCLEFAMLIQTQLGVRTKPLDVYIFSEQATNLPFSFPEIFRVHEITRNDRLLVGSFTLTFSENKHEIPCCAIKVSHSNGKNLVYSADTGYTPQIIDFAKEVDLLLIECSFFKKQQGLVKGHLATYEVGEIAEKANVKQVLLTHFPHFGQIDQLVEEVKEITKKDVMCAKDGFSINL